MRVNFVPSRSVKEFLLSSLLSTMVVNATAVLANSDVVSRRQIVFGAPWEPLGFNPIRALDSGSYAAQTLVYEGLVKYDSRMEIVPAIARKFFVSTDGLTYSFSLRDKARFSDGSNITVDDVVASISLAKSNLSPYKADFACIAKIEKNGERDLSLRLDKQNAPFLARLVDLRILPARVIAKADQNNSELSNHPIGSGPFRLARWESGLELVFEPNPNYWDGPPEMSKLVWRVVPDKTLLAVAMRRGELDVAAIDAATWLFIERQGGAAKSHLVLDKLHGSRTVYLGFNLHRQPFDDLHVRQAIAASIDRNQLCSRFYDKLAVVPLTDVPTGSWVYKADVVSTPANATAAEQALINDGYKLSPLESGDHRKRNLCWSKQGKMLSLRIVTVRDLQDVAQIVADDLVRMHIACEVQVMEYSTLRSRYLRRGDFDAMLWSRSSGPDPECTLVWKTKGALNFSGYSDEKIDALIDSGRTATSRTERKAIYGQIQDTLAKQLPWVFLAQPNLLLVHRDSIVNIEQGSQSLTGMPWDNPLFNAAKWRWR